MGTLICVSVVLMDCTRKEPALLNNKGQAISLSPSVNLSDSMQYIPGGSFEMGDHKGFVDQQHPSDEFPVHSVYITAFNMDRYDITNDQYCDFLNSSLQEKQIDISDGKIYCAEGKDVLFLTRESDQYSRISWNGDHFYALDNRGNHPVTSVMWCGAAFYCNWKSNGLSRKYSTVDQWTPPIKTDGNYELNAGSAFGPADFSWRYQADPPSSLYDEAISGAQRLPNGNTLIDSGTHGRFIEVTPSGETVWEYVNPVVKTGPLGRTEEIPSDPAREGEFLNACFRVLRYGLDYPAFNGKNLTPAGTIEK
jgi:hypothetical protein